MRDVWVCEGLTRSWRELVRSGSNALEQAAAGLVDPAMQIGVVLLAVTTCLLASNIFAPPPYGRDPHNGLPVLNGAMALLQQPFDTAAYLAILAACACWLQIRFRASLLQCGISAAQITLFAGAPAFVAALLILCGALRVIVLEPGETPTTFREHGFALTYYCAGSHAPAAWLQMLSVVFRLPESFFWGVVGGLLGRGIAEPAERSSPLPA